MTVKSLETVLDKDELLELDEYDASGRPTNCVVHICRDDAVRRLSDNDILAAYEDRELGEESDDAVQSESLAVARALLFGSDVPEALLYIERALPADFSGLADRVRRYYEARR